MKRFITVVALVFSTPLMSSDLTARVVGDHDFLNGQKVLLHEVGTDCYLMGVSSPNRLKIIGKSCLYDHGVVSEPASYEIEISYPLKHGQELKLTRASSFE